MMRIMSRRVTVFILSAAISLLSCNGGDMAPAASYLTVSDKEIEVFSDSKSGSIVFGCDGSWTAFSEDEWIHLQENSGKGSDTDCSLVFYLDENDTGADRYGVISVSAGKFYENVMIIQSAASGHSITAFFRQVFSGNFSKVYICAHRANTYGGMYEDKNCPENSIPAIRRCIEAGLDMVELDVRKTKDGILVLCHDDKIDNVTNGSGKIADMTYAQICGYDMKIRTTGPVVPGVRIPTLSEALAECKDKIWVNLDLNKCTIPASEIVGAIEQAGMLDQVTCYTGSDAELIGEASLIDCDSDVQEAVDIDERLTLLHFREIPAEHEIIAEYGHVIMKDLHMEHIPMLRAVISEKRIRYVRPQAAIACIEDIDGAIERIALDPWLLNMEHDRLPIQNRTGFLECYCSACDPCACIRIDITAVECVAALASAEPVHRFGYLPSLKNSDILCNMRERSVVRSHHDMAGSSQDRDALSVRAHARIDD